MSADLFCGVGLDDWTRMDDGLYFFISCGEADTRLAEIAQESKIWGA
jgi:hypothetical protein